MQCGLLPVMHRSGAYSSTSNSRRIRWLPSPEVCRMLRHVKKVGVSLRQNNNIAVTIFSIKKERVAISDALMLLCLFAYVLLNYIFECYRNTYMSKRNEFK